MELEINKLLNVLKLSAQIIIENGGETYRAEETIKYICKSFNVKEIEPIATPTGLYFTISINGEENNTIVKRIRKRTVNLQKINDVNNISRDLISRQVTLDEALLQLEDIYNNDKIQYKYSLLYGGISSAFFTLLFGGGLFEFTVALFSGIIITIISKKFEELHSYQFFSSIVAGAFLSFIAITFTYLFGKGNYNYIIVGGIMPLLPGLAMTNAIRDTIRGDLLSGIARATEALLVASSLAAGAGAIIYTAYTLGIS
ncbi:threonine/serine exporter family protein [Sedimentibacter sp.]|uniref:threonine/serine ThrE exporter family protein n=1 Tax=Sedimentibacter sp. TaxID=1960295 RepID=UPI0028A7E9AD|nr:threonine/serine exporter family protein [Sedimentibacter sp.]